MAAGSPVALLVPAVVTLALVTLCAAPPVFMAGWTPMGFFLPVAVFSLVGVRGLPVWLLVALSLFADTLVGTPLGLHGAVGLLVRFVAIRHGRALAGKYPPLVWLVSALLLVLAQGAVCVALLAVGKPVAPVSAALSWLVSLPLVPPVALVAALCMRE